MKVFINPGHAPNGNPDPGACGYGLREADVAAKRTVEASIGAGRYST